MSDLDISGLVLAEHDRFRRQFSEVMQLRSSDHERAAESWRELADELEVHASAEEEILYPQLLAVGDEDRSETDDAVRDHNDIRDATREAGSHEPGSDDWWDAVGKCQDVTSHHLDEEERDVLPELRERLEESTRSELGERWLAFHDEHDRARGLSGEDKDPERYIEDNS
jgi:hemerythrin superfamily protein